MSSRQKKLLVVQDVCDQQGAEGGQPPEQENLTELSNLLLGLLQQACHTCGQAGHFKAECPRVPVSKN